MGIKISNASVDKVGIVEAIVGGSGVGLHSPSDSFLSSLSSSAAASAVAVAAVLCSSGGREGGRWLQSELYMLNLS